MFTTFINQYVDVRVGKVYRILGFLLRNRKLRGKGGDREGLEMWGWSEIMMRVVSWEGMCWKLFRWGGVQDGRGCCEGVL